MKALWYLPKRPVEERSEEDTAALTTARFIPRYTAYVVTYYANKPKRLWERRIKAEQEYGADDPEYEPMILAGMHGVGRNAYNLRSYVERGKLKWLDLSSPDLPLKSGPVEEFPYIEFHDFTGKLKPYYL